MTPTERTLNKYYVTFPSWSPGSDKYCEIIAPTKKVARVLTMEVYRMHWAFIYTEEDFEGQPEKYNLSKTRHSPLTSEPISKYYEDNLDRLLKKLSTKYN